MNPDRPIYKKLLQSYLLFAVIAIIFTIAGASLILSIITKGGANSMLPMRIIGVNGSIQNKDPLMKMGGWIEELSDDHMVLAENEKNVLGFYFSFNPIIAVKKKYNIECDNLYNLSVSTGPVKGFGLIKRVKSLKTKRGEMMAFVDLVDDKGSISLAVMPKVYAMHSSQLIKGKYLVFEGKMEKETSCLVRTMEVL